MSSSVQASPAKISLSWPQDTNGTPSSYTIYRKLPTDASWGGGKTLPGTALTYTDIHVAVGTAYEYKIVKATGAYTGYGYIETGIDVPLVDRRGKVLLIVDNTFSVPLASELARLQLDLTGDGWTVIRHDVNRTDPVATVKNLIKADYAADPTNVKSVFLFGHIAVPYSGQFNPDGHPDHIGAWPADVYYGDVNGNWTDASVNFVQAVNTDAVDAARITNIPGDGKFDQTDIPSTIKLQVGRVDLANMPGRTSWGGPATFASETELMRKYLNKDHAFRTRATSVPRRAVVGDYFGIRGGEAFAASGFRAFAPLVGAANIRNLNTEFNDRRGVWVLQTSANDYLLAYGCGAGSYNSISGLGNAEAYNGADTPEFVNQNVRGVFNLIFGSWLGDWDHEDDILRAPLATDYGLVSVWSGRPHWFIHPLGLGETTGYVTQLTQNNVNTYETQINTAAHRVHIALMGDPTLRLHPVAPVGLVNGLAVGGSVSLNWTPSVDSDLVGYHVYRAASLNGPFTRLTPSPVSEPHYSDAAAPAGAVYMVRAIKLENTTSGSYYNGSVGVFWSADTGTVATVAGKGGPAKATTAPATPVASSGGSTAPAATTATPSTTLVSPGAPSASLPTASTSVGITLTGLTPATSTPLVTTVSADTSSTVKMTGPIPTPTGSASTSGGTVIWIDDDLPANAGGAGGTGDTWNWVTGNPTPFSGSKAHRSDLAPGLHEHWFGWSDSPLTVNTGEILFTYVYLDPANMPSELMVSWSTSSSWEHRAYWGANRIDRGSGQGRYYAGPLPTGGQWVRLEVPASAVGLDASTVTAMDFSCYDDTATWDAAGKMSAGLLADRNAQATTAAPGPPVPRG